MDRQTGLDPNLEALGYKPQLRGVLTRADLILYGLVILTPRRLTPFLGSYSSFQKAMRR